MAGFGAVGELGGRTAWLKAGPSVGAPRWWQLVRKVAGQRYFVG